MKLKGVEKFTTSECRQKGVTLIELMVAVAITSAISILLLNFMSDKLVANAIQSARSDLQQQAQLTLDAINRDIKHAANIDSPNRWEDNYAPGAPADEFSWTSDNDTLILATPVQNSGGEIIYEDPNTYVSYKDNFIYFTSGGVLYKRTLAATVSGNHETTTCPAGTSGCPADRRLAENVQSFTMTYYDANDAVVSPSQARSVAVTLVLQRDVYNQTLTGSHTVRSVFRNE